MKVTAILSSILVMLLVVGCKSPRGNISSMRLGMNEDEVRHAMGKPFAIRTSKVYEDGQVSTVWEYVTTRVTLFPKTYWVYFVNGKVVQWGEPGDFSGKAQTGNIPVSEYRPEKLLK